MQFDQCITSNLLLPSIFSGCLLLISTHHYTYSLRELGSKALLDANHVIKYTNLFPFLARITWNRITNYI